jgi:hypothetical protein
MLYTIGKTESYEQYFREQRTPRKLGRIVGYEGGSIWLTREDAENYLKETGQTDYSVYGVRARIEDTEEVKGRPWRSLLVTSDLVKLQ